MRRLLSAVFPRANAKALRSAALLTLLLVLVAHGFCFTNLTYSGASVMLNTAKGSSAQISSGAFLLPIYWRIRGRSPRRSGSGCSAPPIFLWPQRSSAGCFISPRRI